MDAQSKKVVFFKKIFFSKNFQKILVSALIIVFEAIFWTLKNDKCLSYWAENSENTKLHVYKNM